MILAGLESSAPEWVTSDDCGCDFVSCDLTGMSEARAQEIFQRSYSGMNISKIVIGVRPKLFTANIRDPTPRKMLEGIEILLRYACRNHKIDFVLHISSVAAADHLREQVYVSEFVPLPPKSEYTAPYDSFKRDSEDCITEICNDHRVPHCHLRLSAIFSDDPSCIQCSALGLQSRIGAFTPIAIDCNSSLNVSKAIRALLMEASKEKPKIRTVYYYTRPLHLEQPVPYGFYLQEFRKAHSITTFSFWIPFCLVTWFTGILHWIAKLFPSVPYMEAADYLMQVASREHSFDCSLLAGDFWNLRKEEETIFECFVRRRKVLEGKLI